MTDKTHPIRILIVDDEERLLRILRLGLKPLGYDVRTAANGEEGLQAMLNQDLDIILTDLNMPTMRGDELIYEMERLSIHVPVIVITAYADVETAVKTLKHGAVDYLRKPFTVQDVDLVVRQVLDKHQPDLNVKVVSLKEGVEKAEKDLIQKALLKTKGNKTAAAKLLDIAERTLWYKIKKYDVGQ